MVIITRDGRGQFWVNWRCAHGMLIEADQDGCVWCHAEAGDRFALHFLEETERVGTWRAKQYA